MRQATGIVAFAMMVCFLVLSWLDHPFWMLHVYEALIYALIALLFMRSHTRWPETLGILAPSAWLLLAVVTAAFGEPMREITAFLHAHSPNYAADFVGCLVSALSIVMITLSAYDAGHYPSGGRGSRGIFAASLSIVIAYYTILAFWFWRVA